jgi:hypothetical protein
VRVKISCSENQIVLFVRIFVHKRKEVTELWRNFIICILRSTISQEDEISGHWLKVKVKLTVLK